MTLRAEDSCDDQKILDSTFQYPKPRSSREKQRDKFL